MVKKVKKKTATGVLLSKHSETLPIRVNAAREVDLPYWKPFCSLFLFNYIYSLKNLVIYCKKFFKNLC